MSGGEGGAGAGGMSHAKSSVTPRLYPHATYHGPTQHHRTPLPGVNASAGVAGGAGLNNVFVGVGGGGEMKPIRFTDSPQHGGHTSGRRHRFI